MRWSTLVLRRLDSLSSTLTRGTYFGIGTHGGFCRLIPQSFRMACGRSQTIWQYAGLDWGYTRTSQTTRVAPILGALAAGGIMHRMLHHLPSGTLPTLRSTCALQTLALTPRRSSCTGANFAMRSMQQGIEFGIRSAHTRTYPRQAHQRGGIRAEKVTCMLRPCRGRLPTAVVWRTLSSSSTPTSSTFGTRRTGSALRTVLALNATRRVREDFSPMWTRWFS
mmetsp:Transcript_29186/g.76408  ORF Transcript_29186/g.76408 Transcript_29186/m.76408 type:complete len:222 (+) Transcript_29186:306-971(+)